MLKIIMDPKFFPSVIMLESILASCVWFTAGDMRKGAYWLAGAIITASVTF